MSTYRSNQYRMHSPGFDRRAATRGHWGGAPNVKEATMARTILVHLSVDAPDTDTRTADEIADAIMAAIEVGADDDSVRDLTVTAPLAEEVGA